MQSPTHGIQSCHARSWGIMLGRRRALLCHLTGCCTQCRPPFPPAYTRALGLSWTWTTLCWTLSQCFQRLLVLQQDIIIAGDNLAIAQHRVSCGMPRRVQAGTHRCWSRCSPAHTFTLTCKTPQHWGCDQTRRCCMCLRSGSQGS